MQVWAFILNAMSMSFLSYSQSLQIPKGVQQELMRMEQRFGTVLEEECKESCYASGCLATRFDTLDEAQTSSLPGLEDDKISDHPQYRLRSVQCEFTFEPELNNELIQSIKQRVRQRVRNAGIDLQIIAKPLDARVDDKLKGKILDENAFARPPEGAIEKTWIQAFAYQMLPFIPWFSLILLATICVLAMIWGIRSLGLKNEQEVIKPSGSSEDSLQVVSAEPSPAMFFSRIEQLSKALKEDPLLLEQTLKRRFNETNLDDLTIFLKLFGAELLQVFRSKAEYHQVLTALGQRFSEKEPEISSRDLWAFLDRLERDMTSAKVRMETTPIEEEFRFLSGIPNDDLLHLFKELSEEEAMVLFVYAPKNAKDAIFADSQMNLAQKFLEQVTSVTTLSDAYVRMVARKLRQIHQEKGDLLRTLRVDSLPLIEEALSTVDTEKRKELIRGLERQKPGLLTSYPAPIFLDESLTLLPLEFVTEALLNVSPEELGHYLTQYPWSKDLLHGLSPRLAEGIRPHLKRGSELRRDIADQARAKIAVYMKKAHHEGVIDLSEINKRLIRGEGG